MTSMPAITVYQPHATLVALGIKHWETRPSPPHGDMCPPGVRGLPGCKINRGDTIAIHAAASTAHLVRGGTIGDHHVSDALGDGWRLDRSWIMPFGAVIATATVADCLLIMEEDCPHGSVERCIAIDWTEDDSMELAVWRPERLPAQPLEEITDQFPYGDWTPGRWAWQLVDVTPCDPIPAKGKQGVWRWEP